MAKAKKIKVTKQKSIASKKTTTRPKAKSAKASKSVRQLKTTKTAKKGKTLKVTKTVKKKPVAKKNKKVMFTPKGYHTITPYLFIREAAKAIEFYKKVFSAKEAMRMEHSGKIGHAELKIGDAKIMLADECPEMKGYGPEYIGGTPVGIHLYVKNVDAVIEAAVKMGATVLRPAETMFYGDRCGTIEDPFGHRWFVSTHVEDVTPAQVRKRAAALFDKK